MPQQPQQPQEPQQQPPQPPPSGYGYPGAGPGGPHDAGHPDHPGQPGPNPYGHPQPGQPPYPGYAHPGYPAPGYLPPGTFTGDPQAPYGYDLMGRPYSDKSKIVASVLQLTLGTFGVGRFYMGDIGIGLAQLFTCGGLGIWALIDGIVLLVSDDKTDANGRILRG
ncbi:TM2 domain-containing protein [Streptomyces sp. NPDC002602]|uniref:TM2 domain-containing protein n=1 Tax=Streptomyces sp. NPDC002602 TaxID=3364654 RepID=UPI00367D96E3